MYRESFCTVVSKAQRVTVLTGAGISAESGVPTFRGAGGLWRKYQAIDLATPTAFRSDPGLVWEFYEYRRVHLSRCTPNPAHHALAAWEVYLKERGKRFTLITQNVGRLHQAAGSQNIIELHGSIWLVKPYDVPSFAESPGKVWEDRNVPICKGLAHIGTNNPDDVGSFDYRAQSIPLEDLPHSADGRLLRPAVVWFGESLDQETMSEAMEAIQTCDLLLVIGTSSVVYPAAGFAEIVAARGVPVVEINLEPTPNTTLSQLKIEGKAAEILPQLIKKVMEEDGK